MSHMPGRMALVKKPRNTTKLPLALNPTKSKDVLAVLAERNQAVIPVGAWVEPASPNSSEITAHTSACMIEEELKEQQRKKQEALKHFQKQVKYRVNQQIRLRKKQQLLKSYEAAEKEGSVAMQSSDRAHLTPKRTSVFPSNLNAAIGSFRLPHSQMVGDVVEDGENQNKLFQQAQALSHTMKQARHQLASFKTKALSRKPEYIKINIGTRRELPLKIHQDLLATVHYQNLMENQGPDYVMTDEKWREDLFCEEQQDLLSEDKTMSFNRVQKVKFKTPLFVVMEEDKQKELYSQRLQDILPEAQDCLLEAQCDLPETQGDLIEVQSVKPESPGVEPDIRTIEPECQTTGPESKVIKTETQSTELEDGNTYLESQDFPPQNQALVPRGQNFLSKCQGQNSLPKDHGVLPKDLNILPKSQDQNFQPVEQDFLPGNWLVLPKEHNILLRNQDQNFLPKDQCVLPKDQKFLPKYEHQNFLPKDQNFLPRDDQCVLLKEQNILLEYQDQEFLPVNQDFLPRDQNILPKCEDQNFLLKGQCVLPKDQTTLHKCQEQDFQPPNQEKYFWPPPSALTAGIWKKECPTSTQWYLSHRFPRQFSTRDKLEQKEEEDQQEKVCFKEPFFDRTDEKEREDFSLAGDQYLPLTPQFQDFIRDQDMFLLQPSSFMREEKEKEELPLEYHQYVPPKIQDQFSPGEEHRNYGQASCGVTDERWRKELFPKCHGYGLHEIQDPGSAREQSLHFRQQPSIGTIERWQGNLLLDDHHHLPSRHQRDTCSRRQEYDDNHLGLSTEFQVPLAFQSGVDQEEDKKERQKQYLRYRRLFMDIEREQVKEQKREKEQKKKVEKIKKKKEQQRYAEEQRILKMNLHEGTYSEEKMSDMLAQLRLEELKETREKQQQREKEYISI
ncbi:coiled-coil domain-containing protein 15 isoform X3 [Castor canadensis]|uniref:Coiled-coil domain-containing protein 15 isoform X3 n=1 Tax=Castor canadensis TaxID=51338 RepID=A0AC58LZI5_CASCN